MAPYSSLERRSRNRSEAALELRFWTRVRRTYSRLQGQPGLSWSGNAVSMENFKRASDPLSTAVKFLEAPLVPSTIGTIPRKVRGENCTSQRDNVPGAPIVAYNLHLESRGNDALRLSQIQDVLQDC